MSTPTQLIIETAYGPVTALRAEGDSGAPQVLFVPGYTGSKEDFQPLLEPLSTAGFTATAIDLPGQYESAGPADPAAYTPNRLAAVVIDIAAQLGRSDGRDVHLVGHSFGGLVARAAVIAAPTLFASLVLMSSGPAAIAGPRRNLIEHLEPILAESGLAAVYAESQAVYRAQPGYVEPPPAKAEFLQKRFLANVPAMLQGMGAALRVEPDRVTELAATTVPKLVLYGETDDAWPPALQDEMARRLGAERRIVPDAAHSPAVENPEATTQVLISFWRSVRG